MLVRKWNEQKRTLDDAYQFVAAKDIGWYSGLLNRVIWNGDIQSDTYTLPGVSSPSQQTRREHKMQKDIPLKYWLRFIGIYLAEGTMLKRDQRKDRVSYKIQIAGVKKREKEFIRETLSEIGVTYLELSDRFTEMTGLKAPVF